MMTGLWHDLRYALRSLGRTPGFTAVAVLTLALGIGANTAVFSLVRWVLIHPLPYAEPERLYSVHEDNAQQGTRPASYPTFLDWRAQARVFDGLAFIRGQTVIFRSAEGPEQVIAGYVSPDFFRVVGEAPRLGRGFLPDEEQSGEPVAVISDELWRRRFGGEPSAVGRTMPVGDAVVRIVGVMPQGFAYPPWATLWMPIAALPPVGRPALSERTLHTDSRVIGRLAQGVGLDRAQSEMNTIAARLATAYPSANAGWSQVAFWPLADELLGDAATRLLVLQATVAIVLLIACVNVVSLSLARGMARSRELALRAALGASRWRLVRQLLVESLVLALVGGVAGAVLAEWALTLLKTSAPDVLPRLQEVTLDGWAMGFTAGLSILATVGVGLLPALRVTRPDLLAGMNEAGGRAGAGPRRTRLYSILVVGELALAMVLLVGAGLLIRSFDRLQQVALGFDPGGLLTLRVVPPSSQYDNPERLVELYRRLSEAVGALPGVRSVALTNHMPLTGASASTRIELEGRAPDPQNESSALFRTVSAEYFGTMRIPIVRGRALSAADLSHATGAVVVNQAFVRRYWPNLDPIGRRVSVFKSVQNRADFGERADGVVVGVVGDVRHFSQEDDLVPEVYLPYTRNPPTWIQLVVRASGDPARLIPALRHKVLAVDPGLPVVGEGMWQGITTMDQFLAASRAPRTFNSVLLSGFAATALLLALVGLYGIVSYLVVQRAREIGVRVALGARPGDVVALVLGRSLRWCLWGVVLGTAGAFALTRFIASLLFGVAPTDPATFVVVALGLGSVTALASFLPARRAAGLDPMQTLRSE
jgi:putative ABC transport system permease protein